MNHVVDAELGLLKIDEQSFPVVLTYNTLDVGLQPLVLF